MEPPGEAGDLHLQTPDASGHPDSGKQAYIYYSTISANIYTTLRLRI
jgi:hypothetical protein